VVYYLLQKIYRQQLKKIAHIKAMAEANTCRRRFAFNIKATANIAGYRSPRPNSNNTALSFI